MSKYQTLTQTLAEMERTDPAVAEAARKYDAMAWRIARGGPYMRRPKRKLTPAKRTP